MKISLLILAGIFSGTFTLAGIDDPATKPGNCGRFPKNCPPEDVIPKWSLSGKTFKTINGHRLEFVHYRHYKNGYKEQFFWSGQSNSMVYEPATKKHEFDVYCINQMEWCGTITKISPTCLQVEIPSFTGKVCTK